MNIQDVFFLVRILYGLLFDITLKDRVIIVEEEKNTFIHAYIHTKYEILYLILASFCAFKKALRLLWASTDFKRQEFQQNFRSLK